MPKILDKAVQQSAASGVKASSAYPIAVAVVAESRRPQERHPCCNCEGHQTRQNDS